MKLYAVILFFLSFYVTSSIQYCYSTDQRPYRGYSFPTSYDFVHGNFSNLTATPKGCLIQHIWFGARHGTRYPSTSSILKINFFLPKIRQHLLKKTKPHTMCDADYKLLEQWHQDPFMVTQNKMRLAEQGIKDHHELGKRIRKLFPSVFNNKSLERNKRFTVRSSNTERTIDSMKAFLHGCFKSDTLIKRAIILKKDCLLQACKPPIQGSSETYARKFGKSRMFRNMVKGVIRRWNLKPIITGKFIGQFYDYFKKNQRRTSRSLEATMILTLHRACATETATHRKNLSPWCAAFAEEDLRIIEYYLDLRASHKYGYAKNSRKQIGFPLINDMVQKFVKLEKIAPGEQPPTANFYFTHDSVLLPLITAMGFFKDRESLTDENYHEMKYRKWKTSQITPFAGNLMAVFYTCPSIHAIPAIPGLRSSIPVNVNKVRFFVNEKAVKVEECDNRDLCDWWILKNKFKKTLGQ